jgi:uncharacterized protein (DUF1330 family)
VGEALAEILMAFKSKAQWRYCFASQKKHPTWNCRKWAHKTPSYKALPRRKGVSLRTLR